VGDVSEPRAVSTRRPGEGVPVAVGGRYPTLQGLFGTVPFFVYLSATFVPQGPLRVMARRVLAEVGAAPREGFRRLGAEVVARCGEGEGGGEARSSVKDGEEVGGDAEKDNECVYVCFSS